MSSENLNESKESVLPSDNVIKIKCKGCEKEYLPDGIFKHFSKYEGKNHCLPMYTCDELKALKCHQKILTNHKSLCYHQTMLSRLNAIPGHIPPSPAIFRHPQPSPAISRHLRPFPAIPSHSLPSPAIPIHPRPSLALPGHLRPSPAIPRHPCPSPVITCNPLFDLKIVDSIIQRSLMDEVL